MQKGARTEAGDEARGQAYERTVVHQNDESETLEMFWKQGVWSAPHDHGAAVGQIELTKGTFEELVYEERKGRLQLVVRHSHISPLTLEVPPGQIHAMRALTLTGESRHRYEPNIKKMRVFDLDAGVAHTVTEDCGAWLPKQKQIRSSAGMTLGKMGEVLVAYTTEYREGGAEKEIAAQTLAEELEQAGQRVTLSKVETKSAFVASIRRAAEGTLGLSQLHFCGHAGLYGPMFGTRALPEQLSPYEWQMLARTVAFNPGGQAYFHTCRSARWFAPFFARTFGVRAFGYQWYTTFSAEKKRFRLVKNPTQQQRLYLFGSIGKKSHGVLGSLLKYSGLAGPEAFKEFQPGSLEFDAAYDDVAKDYAEAFQNIRVRRDEWQFLTGALAEAPAGVALDIGCGSGSLLRALVDEGLIARGLGVDQSSKMVDVARAQSSAYQHLLHFDKVEEPAFSVEDASVDVVISCLSFRYLDWDPLMLEIRRVLKPGGRLLICDMVARPLSFSEVPSFVYDRLRTVLTHRANRRYAEALKAMVASPAWQRMLHYNPIRAEHEMRWYLESRFPDGKCWTLNRSRTARLLAFDSGPLPQDFPLPATWNKGHGQAEERE